MRSRVAVRNEADGVVVIIKPRPGHFITVIALIGLALLAFLNHMSLFTAITAWSIPVLGIVFFEIWQLFAYQKICLRGKKATIGRWLGSYEIGEAIEIDMVNVCNVHIEEYSYKSKGGSYVSRTLVFSSNDGIIARSWQLSPEDGRVLLEGPFRHFRA